MNEDMFKAVIHEDQAFKALLEREGSEVVLTQLQAMRMKMTTQIATFGNEREAWFKRVNGLLVVVRNRIDEVKEDQSVELADYKDVLTDILARIQEKFDKYDITLPDIDNLDAIDDWVDEVGL